MTSGSMNVTGGKVCIVSISRQSSVRAGKSASRASDPLPLASKRFMTYQPRTILPKTSIVSGWEPSASFAHVSDCFIALGFGNRFKRTTDTLDR